MLFIIVEETTWRNWNSKTVGILPQDRNTGVGKGGFEDFDYKLFYTISLHLCMTGERN